MDLWITEYQTPSLGFACKVKETLAMEQTPFQFLSIVDTEQFGRMLLLDGMVMTTEKDEFVYHEMITQIVLNSHPRPRQVLIIGGGDGGALREVVDHPLVEKGTLVEIDEVLFSLYLLGILIALIMGKLFSKTLFKGESSHFIMELPPYRIPSAGNVVRDMWEKVWDFLKRAGTVIFAVVSLLWVLSVLPFGVEPYSRASLLGRIGEIGRAHV